MAKSIRLSGYAAINFAALTGATLRKYEDPTEEAWESCTPEQARRVAREDPSLIYCDAGALLVIDGTTDADETSDEAEIMQFGGARAFGPKVKITDRDLIRALYDDPSATAWGDCSYVVGL